MSQDSNHVKRNRILHLNDDIENWLIVKVCETAEVHVEDVCMMLATHQVFPGDACDQAPMRHHSRRGN